jgi:hypothetical protein
VSGGQQRSGAPSRRLLPAGSAWAASSVGTEGEGAAGRRSATTSSTTTDLVLANLHPAGLELGPRWTGGGHGAPPRRAAPLVPDAGLAAPLPGTPCRRASRRDGRLPRAAARRSRGGEVGTMVAVLRKRARLLGAAAAGLRWARRSWRTPFICAKYEGNACERLFPIRPAGCRSRRRIKDPVRMV